MLWPLSDNLFQFVSATSIWPIGTLDYRTILFLFHI